MTWKSPRNLCTRPGNDEGPQKGGLHPPGWFSPGEWFQKISRMAHGMGHGAQ